MTEHDLPWRLDFYARADGRKPAEEFITALETSRPADYRKILSKFRYFERMGLRAAMDLKVVAPLRGYNGICELRIKGTGFRFYGFSWHPPAGGARYLLVVSAEEKAGKSADDALIRAAAEARDDWHRRHEKGGSDDVA